jgi:ElaB/YqjD/DUF883 family membrane-anchored ribosome-binding protein
MDEAQTASRKVIEKATASANHVTQTATNAAIEMAVDTVESLRSTLSPRVDDPLGPLMTYTRKKPIQALAVAACAGALITMILRR